MKQSSEMGMNRTGIGMAPRLSEQMIKDAADTTPPTGGGPDMAALRTEYAKQSPTFGSTPPPASMKGVVKTGMKMLQGKVPSVLVNKLGERLAFERTGTRLYEALLAKFDSEGSWDGGPNRAELERFHGEERSHFDMLREVIDGLGGDPTTMTPAADVAAVASEGVLKVMTDPRSTLLESLEALMVAEMADHHGWEGLIAVGELLGQDDMVDRSRQALAEEDNHLSHVRSWIARATEAQVRGELH